MTDLNKTVQYTFVLADNVSQTAQGAADALDTANSKIDAFERNTKEAEQAAQHLDTTVKQVDLVTQLTAVMGFREATSAITGGLIGLGIAEGEAAEQLNKLNAGFSIFAGAVTTIKSVQAVMTTLNGATAVNTALNAFNAVLQSPARMAAVGLAAGAAAGVAGALLITNNSNTSNSTNITVQDTTSQQATSEIYRVVAGGAL